MKRTSKFALVLVTAPNINVGRAIARAALSDKLVACANIVPHVESHYWWEGKIEASAEVLLLMKTTIAKLPALERLILAKHPYQTPEFIALPIEKVTGRYATWLIESLRQRIDRKGPK